MSNRNHPTVKRLRRAERLVKVLDRERYRVASLIIAWCVLLSGSGRAQPPNRERRRGNVTHGRRGY